MSQSVERSHEVYAAVEKAAAGTIPERTDAQQPEAVATEDTAPRSLYDLIKHRVGTCSLGYTDLAERHSEYFMEGMLEKRRQGRL